MLRILMTAVLIVLVCNTAGAESLNIQEMVFCRSIEEREPVEPDSLFSDTVGQIYCYTRVTGVTDTTSIFHVWFHEDVEKAKVELKTDPEGMAWYLAGRYPAAQWAAAS